MKPKSYYFTHSKPGTQGRRRTRWLDDQRVGRALVMSQNLLHQLKFLNRPKRIAMELAMGS